MKISQNVWGGVFFDSHCIYNNGRKMAKPTLSLFLNSLKIMQFLANMFAICHRPSVCRLSVVCLSVTLVHPTQAIEIFGNISTPCGTLAIHDLCIKILRRSSQGNLSVGGVKHEG